MERIEHLGQGVARGESTRAYYFDAGFVRRVLGAEAAGELVTRAVAQEDHHIEETERRGIVLHGRLRGDR